jgi:hypothetical protein
MEVDAPVSVRIVVEMDPVATVSMRALIDCEEDEPSEAVKRAVMV